MSRLYRAAFALLLSCLGAATHAATFQLVTTAGGGFDDATPATPEGGNTGTTLGQQRTILFQTAVNTWGSALVSNRVIKVSASFATLTCGPTSGTLGSAGAATNIVLSDSGRQRYFPIALAEALLDQELNGTGNEINATFNSRVDLNDTGCLGTTRFWYGLSGTPPAGTIALYPVVLHELGHGLGFAALLCRTPAGCTSPTTPYGGYFNGITDIWSDFLRDNDIDGAGTNKRFSAMTNAERVTAFTHDPLLVWDGMSVTTNLGSQIALARNENRLRMYAPNPIVGGSSISHFHSDASPNLLMEPSANSDVFNQTDLADCLLTDVGWENSRCAWVYNNAPTIDAIADPSAILEDAAQQTVNLTGISDNDAIDQAITITASSSNPALIPNPTVNYVSGATGGSLNYTPVANQSGSAIVTVTVRDDGGIVFGTSDTTTRTFTVNVTAVNDAPQATNLSAAEAYTEATTLNLIDIVVSDVDTASVTATLTLSNTGAGSLTTATSGAVTSTFNAGTGVWSANGAIADVNTLLAGVSYVPATNFSANFTLATSISDGVAPAVTGSKAFTGTATNDPPQATNLSTTENYIEDTTLNLTDIVVSDPDSASLTVTLTLAPSTLGALTTATSGAVTSTYNAGTGVWSASGAIANVNTLLAGVSFVPVANGNASGTIATSVSDGVAAAITGSKTLTGTAVNDAPTATNLSAAETYVEDITLNLVDIVASDVDSANVTATLTLSNAAAGSLTTATSGAVTSTYTAGTGVWNATGAIADVNTLLAGVSFVPALNFSQNFSITTSIADGASAPATGSKAFTGTAVNDAPTATNLSTAETYTEDTTLNLTDIVVSDVDSANVTVTLTLAPTTLGALTTATSGAVTSTYNAGTGVWSASGALANVNTLLAGVSFVPAANSSANGTIATSVSDGVAAALTGSKTLAGTAVNDAPTATNLSAAEIYTEDTTLNLIDIVASDIDSANVTATLTLSNTSVGSLTTATSGAVTSTFTAGTGVWTASGAIANVNTLLAGVSFVPTLNSSQGFTLATSISDGALSVTGSKNFVGGPVNDGPNLSNVNGGQIYIEDTPLDLVDFVVSDIDNASLSVTLTLSPASLGSLSTGTSGAVTSTYNAATGVWGVSGAIADVNTLLAGVVFTPTANGNASGGIAVSVSDGMAIPNTGTHALSGTAVNDAPTGTNLSAAEIYTEDTTLNLTDIVAGDIDSTSVTATLTLSNTAAGSLTTATSGAVTSTFNAGTGVWSASGAIANVNTLLAGVSFVPAANFAQNFTLATSISDGALSATGTKNFTAAPVNDPPTATNIGAVETYTEDTPLDLVDIVVTDIDNAIVTVTLTLSPASLGALSTGTSGAVTSTYNAGTGVWSAAGAVANVNTLLAGVIFTPTANGNASGTITVSVSDGVASPVIGTKTLTGVAVNDAPTGTNLSAAETYVEDTTLNLIDIVASDVDTANLTATLTLSNTAAGSLTTATSGAVTSTFNAGTGVWTASGATANVNTLLSGVSFVPAVNFNTNFTLATSLSDGALSTTGNKAFTGTPVNDAPSATNLSASETYLEDTSLDLVDIVVSDIDSANATVTLTVTPASLGALTTATSGAVTSTYNAGTGVWSASGAIANVNTLLAGVSFVPTANGSANGSIAVSVSDGVAAALTGSKTLTGTPVNDPPSGTNLGAAETYLEDTTLDLTNIVVSDVDNTSVIVSLTLSPASLGSLTTGTAGAASSTYTAATGVWLATGPTADVNTLLANVSFVPVANGSASGIIAVSISDGSLNVTGSKTLSGVAVNDPPVVNAPPTFVFDEDTTGTLTTLSVSDIDSASLAITLSVNHGTATLVSTTGLTFTNGDGTGDASMAFNGSIANINAALASVQYTPVADFFGGAQLALAATDASGTTSAQVAVQINPIGDTMPDTISVDEDGTATFNVLTGSGGATADTFEGPAQLTDVQPAAAHGSLTFASNGSVTYTPTANFSGSETFTYTVTAGGVAETGTLTVTTQAINDAPTLAAIPNPTPIPPNAGLQTIALSGIGAGPGETQALTVTASSSNPALTPSLTVNYASPNATGSLSFTTAQNAIGSATITVTVTDDGGTANGGVNTVSRTFLLQVGLDVIFINGFQ